MMQEIIESVSKKKSFTTKRFGFLFLLFFVIISLLVGRGFYLQVVLGAALQDTAEDNRVAAIPITAPRGIIFDRFGQQLVENIASTAVILDPILLPTEENESVLLEKLPSLLATNPAEIQQALFEARRQQRAIKLASAIEHDTVLAIEQAHDDLPGVRLVSTLVRRYTKGDSFAHVLGYANSITAEELAAKQFLSPTAITGKDGVERTYDELLQGRSGVSYVEVDASGAARKQLEQEQTQSGHDLYLTIDADLQQYIFSLFNERADNIAAEQEAKGISGAVVVLDAASGEIRALVSYPSFDANIFSQPSLTNQVKTIINDEANPLFNRAINGTYPPGSTIKPIIAAAGLNEKIINTESTIFSSGGLTIGSWNFPDWKVGGHGRTNVIKALAESVNTFFYLIAGGYQDSDGLGVERLSDYLARFGWGKRTGIDLPAEAPGFIPSPSWKENTAGEPWYIGDTYHMAIGQGDVLATPLQVAVSTASIANGGRLIVPHVTKTNQSIATVKDINPGKKIDILPNSIKTVQQGMREAVVGATGSARALANFSIPLAGKTGTAQIGGTEQTHAWFTSFGPYQNHELVVTVLLDRGGEGDKDAVPFAGKIWQWLLENESNRAS